MGQSVILTAMVVKAANVGEYDRRIVLLTRERGKITAFARGARKPNSSLLAACQPFSFGQFTLFEGRTAYNLVQADISAYFQELRVDLEKAYMGMYFCEFADYFTNENNDESAILKLLYLSLKALSKDVLPPLLIRYIYEIKTLALYGQAMSVFACICCEKEENLVYFDSLAGGTICQSCAQTASRRMRIGQSTLYTLQYIISSPLSKLYTFTVSNEVMKELSKVTHQYLLVHVGHQFKTLEFLEE